MTRTFAMIKPGAQQHTAEISLIIQQHLAIVGSKRLRLSPAIAMVFYQEHRERPFFKELWRYMTSDTVTALVLEHPSNAVGVWRTLLGATDPSQAALGSIRHRFGRNNKLPDNVAHGSDSPGAAEREIAFFFAGYELL